MNFTLIGKAAGGWLLRMDDGTIHVEPFGGAGEAQLRAMHEQQSGPEHLARARQGGAGTRANPEPRSAPAPRPAARSAACSADPRANPEPRSAPAPRPAARSAACSADPPTASHPSRGGGPAPDTLAVITDRDSDCWRLRAADGRYLRAARRGDVGEALQAAWGTAPSGAPVVAVALREGVIVAARAATDAERDLVVATPERERALGVHRVF